MSRRAEIVMAADEIAARYAGIDLDDAARVAISAQARKRVAMQFQVRETATWDHRKL